MKNRIHYINYIDYVTMLFIFLILFVLPVLFTRVDGVISWPFVIKIWKDLLLLLPLFAINHWLFVPKILLHKKYITYLLSVAGIVTLFTLAYYYQDEVLNKKPNDTIPSEQKRPGPIPPYAHLLMYSLLIVGIDTGLLFSKKWHENEKKKNVLEKKTQKCSWIYLEIK